MEFRFADLSDVKGIVATVVNFAKNKGSKTEYNLFSSRHLESELTRLINSPSGCVILSVESNRVVGVLVGTISGSLFSPALAAEELMWWIEPEYRGRGLKMMRMFEQWAKDSGAVMCVMSGFDDLEKFYKLKGYEKRSTHYTKEVK